MIQKPAMIVMPAHETNTWSRLGTDFKYIVLHYVGAVSTARNNGTYYGTTPNIRASAHFFVDEHCIVSSVPLSMAAGHCGVDYSGGKAPFWNGSGKYSTNRQSIGIEMCVKKDAKENWYFEPETVTRTVGLVKWLMQEYKIPIEHVIRHYDVCWKRCPEPWVRDPAQWENFKKRLMEDDEMLTYDQFKDYMRRYESERAAAAPSDYAKDSAKKAVESGLFVDGDGDGSLDNPRANLTREQFAAVLDRAGLLDKAKALRMMDEEGK